MGQGHDTLLGHGQQVISQADFGKVSTLTLEI